MEALARPPAAELLIRTGRPRVAMQQARQELRARPDDIELMAALAVAESRSGYFADAAGSFALCEGAQLYEDLGLEAHANVLRALGDGGQAAALRLQRQLSPLTAQMAFRLWLGASDDLRSIGDIDGAMEMTLAGLSQFPNSGMLHAQLAELHLVQGDIDQAEFHLWWSARQGEHQRWVIAEGRRRLMVGDLIGARELASRFYRSAEPNARFVAFYADALRENGEAAVALHELTTGRWRLTDDPLVLGAHLRLLVALEDWDAAARLAAHASVVYPRNQGLHTTLRAYLTQAPVE